ncbi:MAG: hypothetical protein QOH28_1990 [Actinomycetota bacterium]|nr:hypothetical protein [Actinomycetota bacterium]
MVDVVAFHLGVDRGGVDGAGFGIADPVVGDHAVEGGRHVVPATLVQGVTGCCATVTVDGVGQVADDSTKLFRRVLTGRGNQLGFDVRDVRSTLRRECVRDHDRVPLGDVPASERVGYNR